MELARLDRKRPKKGSNDEWTHPHDLDAKIAKMKDGRTRMAYALGHGLLYYDAQRSPFYPEAPKA